MVPADDREADSDPMRRWRLVTIVRLEIDGFADTRAFDEVVVLLNDALTALGCRARISRNEFSERGVNIVVGANVIDRMQPARRPSLPPNSIILNLEQIHPDNPWMTPNYLGLLRSHPVWDYSLRNLDSLRADFGVQRGVLMQLGYVASLTRIAAAPIQDIDILFYGTMSPRRERMIQRLEGAGHRVKALDGVYGADRDRFIARAKVVLNLHSFDFPSVAEIVRLSFLLCNSKAIVSECNDSTSIEDDIRRCVLTADYSGIPRACAELLDDESRRRQLEQVGHALFRSRDQAEYLRRAISRTVF